MRQTVLPGFNNRARLRPPLAPGPVPREGEAGFLPEPVQSLPGTKGLGSIRLVFEQDARDRQRLHKRVIALFARRSSEGGTQPFLVDFQVDLFDQAGVGRNEGAVCLEKPGRSGAQFGQSGSR